MMVIGGNESTLSTGTITTDVFIEKSLNSTLLAAANSRRACITIINTSKKDLYINYDNAATEESIKISKEDSLTIDCIKGGVYGIWKNGADNGAKIIETTYL